MARKEINEMAQYLNTQLKKTAEELPQKEEECCDRCAASDYPCDGSCACHIDKEMEEAQKLYESKSEATKDMTTKCCDLCAKECDGSCECHDVAEEQALATRILGTLVKLADDLDERGSKEAVELVDTAIEIIAKKANK